jgi:flagellar motor protein MotB
MAATKAATETADQYQIIADIAATFARSGHFKEAEGFALAVPEVKRGAPFLDLLGRIYAQQARFAEAEAQWVKALQIAPDEQAYKRALSAARRREGHPAWLRTAWCLFPVLVIGIAVAFFIENRRKGDVAINQATLTTSAMTAGTSQTASLQPVTIDVMDTRVRSNGQSTTIEFEHGLFSRGVRLSPAAKNQLIDLAHQLHAIPGQFSVYVEGHTDGRPTSFRSRFRDNSELGLARAQAVTTYLHRAGGIALDRFRLTTANVGGQTANLRQNNRTVVISIVR